MMKGEGGRGSWLRRDRRAFGCVGLVRHQPEAAAQRLVLTAALPSVCVVRAHAQKLANVLRLLVVLASLLVINGGRF